MNTIRKPAVAGLFYPSEAQQLKQNIASYLSDADDEAKVPKAIIVPHAGYQYSAPVAASAYSRLYKSHDRIKRVVLLGPSHRVAFNGLALCRSMHYETPLGLIATDKKMSATILQLPYVHEFDQAHEQEHSLEVQLPFLQEILQDFTLLPIVVGNAAANEVAKVLDLLWGGEETLIVISSDLSHFHNYKTAQVKDWATSKKITDLQYEQLTADQACGYIPVQGLLAVLRNKSAHIQNIDLRNSGDTAGDKSRVVGYGAYVVE